MRHDIAICRGSVQGTLALYRLLCTDKLLAPTSVAIPPPPEGIFGLQHMFFKRISVIWRSF